MINKVLFTGILLFFCANPIWAINVLQENSVLQRQLSNLSLEQQKENQKAILYYKGRSSYSGIDRRFYSGSRYSFQNKNVYTKKGVKFKIDKSKQEQRFKEAQELAQQVEKEIIEQNELNNAIELKSNSTKETAIESKDKEKIKPSHNADAE